MSNVVLQFVSGLKSRNKDAQNKAAQELSLYVKTELREIPQDDLLAFFEDFNQYIFEMLSSADINDKKGGVLAISKTKLPILGLNKNVNENFLF